MSIIDSTGKSLQAKESDIELPESSDTLTLEDMTNLDFHPLGPYALVEAMRPECVSESGIRTPFGGGDQPVYRILRSASKGMTPASCRSLKRGSIVFSRSDQVVESYHDFKYPGSEEKRLIALLDMRTIEAVFRRDEWNDLPPENTALPLCGERKVGSPMRDFEEEYIEAVHTLMLGENDIDEIDMEPIGTYIIIENVPVKNITGSVQTPGNAIPLYRILRMPEDTSNFPDYLRFLEVGDVIKMTSGDRRTIPHNFTGPDELPRRLFIAAVGGTVGWYPSLSWRAGAIGENRVHAISDKTSCKEES